MKNQVQGANLPKKRPNSRGLWTKEMPPAPRNSVINRRGARARQDLHWKTWIIATNAGRG